MTEEYSRVHTYTKFVALKKQFLLSKKLLPNLKKKNLTFILSNFLVQALQCKFFFFKWFFAYENMEETPSKNLISIL